MLDRMALKLIVGPPNSGRTGAVLDGFRAMSGNDPVLVVPTVDDVERFEEELTRGGDAVIGATVGTFDELFALVARATDAQAGPAISRTQRLRLAREAASRAELRILAASSRRPGFPAALEELVSELQAALVDPVALKEEAGAAGRYEVEIASLYESYLRVRDELGLHDDHSRAAAATSALRTRPESWESPVFLYGFDDLTVEQLELVRELSAHTQVTIALPWEDRESLTLARGALFAQLRDIEGVSIERLEAESRFTSSVTLFEVERRFGEAGDRVENDGGVALLASAGELAEVEAVGTEVARLLSDGTPPGEIAIVLRDPRSGGPLYRRVLTRFRIPVAVQADMSAARTNTGAGLIALLQAAVGRGRASDLLAYLRTPGVASPSKVDWFERRLLRGRLRTTEQALEAWSTNEENGNDGLREVRKLREANPGAELLREAGKQARWIAESAIRRQGAVAEEDRALELRAGAEIERALIELAELGLSHSAADVIAAVSELDVPMWRGPTEGRVRVISPYRARARRVAHMFVCSMQDGDFPRRDTGGPLLSDEARRALALPERKKAEIEDRYLFSVCLSRAKQRLWLSWRSADDEGGATSRSPFVDEVRDLLAPALPEDLEERDEAIVAEAGGRGLAESVFEPDAAPSEVELARAEAALGPRTENGRLRPGPLQLDPVLERMREIKLFGPSTLEEYATCPYRWFIQHELKPQPIGPEAEPLTSGSIAHKVLEALYENPPAPGGRPTPETLGEWRQGGAGADLGDGREAAASGARGHRRCPPSRRRAWSSPSSPTRPPRRLPSPPPTPRPPSASRTPSRGRCLWPAAASTARSTASISARAERRWSRTTSRAARSTAAPGCWRSAASSSCSSTCSPHASSGVTISPAASTGRWAAPVTARPRASCERSSRMSWRDSTRGRGTISGDEDFEAALDAAKGKAEEIVASVQGGRVIRDPIGGSCPDWCSFQPICRRERGLPEDEPWSEEGEEE